MFLDFMCVCIKGEGQPFDSNQPLNEGREIAIGGLPVGLHYCCLLATMKPNRSACASLESLTKYGKRYCCRVRVTF